LIVGDGCTDNTADVVRGFDDSRIRWFDLPKAPHFGYANRNIVLKQAAGDYIAFMAHDDLVVPDHLTLLARTLEASDAEWAYSCPLWVSMDGCVVPFGVNLENADELEYFLTVANTIPASCIVHRRSCLQKYGYWPEDVESAADWHFWRRIVEGGGRRNLAYCRTPTVLHFVASWKRAWARGMPHVEAGQRLALTQSWWPHALKLTIPPNTTEQEVFFRALQSPDYLKEVRAAVDRVTARLAWDYLTIIGRTQATLPEMMKRGRQLNAEVKRLREELQKKDEELELLKGGSRSSL
jgi:glycosyltransferase involved in cell wall biosynthesis